jgi:hypothetical protein
MLKLLLHITFILNITQDSNVQCKFATSLFLVFENHKTYVSCILQHIRKQRHKMDKMNTYANKGNKI